MIDRIVILKINRALFSPHKPVEVMIGFFNHDGVNVGSQLLSARLFPEEIYEQQQIDFRNFIPQPAVVSVDLTSGRDF